MAAFLLNKRIENGEYHFSTLWQQKQQNEMRKNSTQRNLQKLSSKFLQVLYHYL